MLNIEGAEAGGTVEKRHGQGRVKNPISQGPISSAGGAGEEAEASCYESDISFFTIDRL